MRYKKIIFSVFATLMISVLQPINVYAADKDMSIPFSQDYKRANFIFEFEVDQQHEVIITTPDGREVEYIVIDETANIEIENAVKGTYGIHIEAEDDIKVKARVECSNQSSSDVGNNLTVSSMLTNVKLYFYNGNLKGQWEDTGVGKVNIVVINPKDLRTLSSFSVNGTSFTCEIPETVKSVEVFLVPASSSKVEGAGTAYTLEVVRDLKVYFAEPDTSITNKDNVVIDCELDSMYEVTVYNNGELTCSSKLESGAYELTVPLVTGKNEIEVMTVDEKGNIVSSIYTVEKDVVAPSIQFLDSYNGMTVKESTIVINGVVKDASSLFVNSEEIEKSSSGRFNIECALLKGENVITVCAIDNAGNESVVNLLITRKETNLIPVLLVVTLLVVGLLVFVYVKRIKNTKKTDGLNEEKQVKEKIVKAKKEPKVVEKATKPLKNKKKVEKKRQKESEDRAAEIMKKGNRKNLVIICISYVIMFVAVVLIAPNLIMVSPVTSGSMEPTIMTGDIAIYNKLAYEMHDIERGDIISFKSHEYDMFFTKRVIGIEGDEICFKDGYVFINGMKAEESYIQEEFETNGSKTFKVPAGHIFVMGDNRENSKDSRAFENPYISIEDVIGKYIGQFTWPF